MRTEQTKVCHSCGSLTAKSLLLILIAAIGIKAFSQSATNNTPNAADRPRLTHQSQPVVQSSVADEPATIPVNSGSIATAGFEIGKGLILPSNGHFWATDNFGGVPQLVQLKYVSTDLDRHAGSNVLKSNLAPFMYKPKQMVEIQGAAATVRIHDPQTVIYMRVEGDRNEDEADVSANNSMQTRWALLKLEPKKDRRIVSTIAFTQVTGNARRSSGVIETSIERISDSGWLKLTPKEPLQPGEYGILSMPRGQNLFSTTVFDFAIDPAAPENPNAIAPQRPQ